jgi:malto-oligosyltrehalose synthase
MSVPRATMRFQFHRDFTFADARDLAPYLAALGISHLYASPILTARPGSMHGYDVIDPARINPELGGEAEFRHLVGELRRHGLGLIVDIVPNHMAIGAGNAWWMDVLKNGQDSRYGQFFDIDWEPPNGELRGKVLLPVLGRPYGEALADGEITLARDAANGTAIHYFDHVFPVAEDGAPTEAETGEFGPRSDAGGDKLHRLLERQHYRLAWWRCANDEINWRRFFDINELVAIRIEDDEVFEAVHATIFALYAQGLIDGVRVDHIDGLSYPEAYCRKLRARLRALERERPADSQGGPAYFVVEKILARGESLPASWETDGSTGYDFMDEVSALLHDESGEAPLRALWHRLSGRPGDFAAEEELARRQILARSFSAQLEAVVEMLERTAASDLDSRDIARAAIRRSLSEILTHFPVYRIYARPGEASAADRHYLAQAIASAKATCLPGDTWLLDVLEQWLLGLRLKPEAETAQAKAMARFQQLSAPLCAKAVEDTAFYRYGRLISRNDVGFDARLFALPTAKFHQAMAARAETLPRAMLATATHDHKRGEDVRARLAVLSELPDDWGGAVERWLRLGALHCKKNDGVTIPAAGDLAILFQTIVGAWPLALTVDDRAGLEAYANRLAAWQQKALREAKLHSDWAASNELYERAAADFVAALFAQPSGLLCEMADFARRIGPAGAANGLAQVLAKLTVPGVPDFYQGTEYWDLSLVDPDNRSPVDFAARQKSITSAAPADLIAQWPDGRIKQFLIGRVLAVRKQKPALFSEGRYLPLETTGPLAEHIVAYARILGNSAAIIAICRNAARLFDDPASLTIAPTRWRGTEIHVPDTLRMELSDVLLQQRTVRGGASIAAAHVFGSLPVACLINHAL